MPEFGLEIFKKAEKEKNEQELSVSADLPEPKDLSKKSEEEDSFQEIDDENVVIVPRDSGFNDKEKLNWTILEPNPSPVKNCKAIF